MFKKSNMIKGTVFAAEFLRQLFKAVVKLGGTEKQIYYALKTDSSMIDEFAKLIVGSVITVKKNILHIIASLSLEERIKRGNYDWTNSDINEGNFPENVSISYNTEYELFHFNRSISSENAIKEIENKGFRPGNLVELLAFGEVYPELQREFPILALGSVWRNSIGLQGIPCLRSDDSKRGLGLNWCDLDWSDHCRFLAIHK